MEIEDQLLEILSKSPAGDDVFVPRHLLDKAIQDLTDLREGQLRPDNRSVSDA